MRMAVTDTETTGIDELDQVLEVAIVPILQYLEKGSALPITSEGDQRWEFLMKPTVPITIEARAAHHITDNELSWAFSLTERLTDLKAIFKPKLMETVFVAHNAEFDLRLLRQTIAAAELEDFLPARHICTFICAKHLYPDSPRFSNQVLRYYLGLDDLYPGDFDNLGMPHRAMPDAVVTSRLLMHMLRTKTPEELILLTQTPVLQVYCNMPKHRGKTWTEVAQIDQGYCRWMLAQGPEVKDERGEKRGFDADTIHTLKYHLGLL